MKLQPRVRSCVLAALILALTAEARADDLADEADLISFKELQAMGAETVP